MTRGKDAAEAAARRAIAIAPKLGSPYAELAGIEEDRFNFDQAQQYVRQAIALSPGDPKVISTSMYIRWYVCGEPDKALQLADHLADLNPLTPTSYSVRSAILIDLRRYAEAIQAARKSLQLAPSREWPHQLIANALILMNRPIDARSQLNFVPADDLYRLASRRDHCWKSARHERCSRERLANPEGLRRFRDVSICAGVRAGATARPRLRGARKRISRERPRRHGVRTDPFLDPIRRDPRYLALVKKVNFPACT